MEVELEFDDEITDEELKRIEEEIMGFAGPLPLQPPPPSEERMQSILKRAKLEAVTKETADFLVDGMAPTAKGLLDALLSLTKKKDDDEGSD